MKDLQKTLLSGGVLRYRPAFGFYTVTGGKDTPVSEEVGRKAVTDQLVRPNGTDGFGAYVFALNNNSAHLQAAAAQQRASKAAK